MIDIGFSIIDEIPVLSEFPGCRSSLGSHPLKSVHRLNNHQKQDVKRYIYAQTQNHMKRECVYFPTMWITT